MVEERGAPEPDEIEVEAALPEPLTEEERVQRLGVIKARVIAIYPRYKKYARRLHTVMVETGQLLIEARGIVGRGRFMTWVEEHMPFSHSTANNYMKLVTDLGFGRIVNLALQGTVDAIEAHFAKKNAAQARKWKREEKAARRATLPQSPLERKRRLKQLSFRDNRMFKRQQHEAAQHARSEQYQAQDLQDLTKLPRPHQDAARFEIEWQLPDEVICGIFVWLPEDGHATAGAEGAFVSAGRWKGDLALRYRWIVYTKGNDAKDNSVAIDDDHTDGTTWTVGKTWEEVQAKLSECSQHATEVRRAELMDRDPATARILDTWREQHSRHRCRR